tara:strand:+ start:182 stop:994 length:813 start_codon:yes stop_codon:yes gene_type:complete
MGYKTKSMLHAKGKGPISDYYTKVKAKLNDLNKVSENKSSVNRYGDERESSATRSSSRSKINPGTGARLGDTASQVWDFFGKKSSPKGSSETKTKIEGKSLVSSNEGTSSAEAAETSSFGPQKSGLGVELSSAFSENPLSLDMNSPESLPTLSTKSDAFSKGMGRKNKKKVVSAETFGERIKEKQNAEAIVKMNPKGAQKPPSLRNETGFSNTMQKQDVPTPQKQSRRQENNFVQSKDHSTALQKAKEKFGNRTEFNLTRENGMYTYTKK